MNDSRRRFLTAAAFSIVPRHVLGGPGYVPPSDKIRLAHIGTGTQGLREIGSLLASPELQVVAVCDPSKNAIGYRDFSKTGLLNEIRRLLEKPSWKPGGEDAIPGGRDVAKDVVESYYGKNSANGKYSGCAAFADYRELLASNTDFDAVKIMTPDHLHATIAISAMRKRKHVIVHKPLANRLKEARMVVDTARETGVSTHFMPWDSNGRMEQVMAWIRGGEIGTLREVHNWTNRPVWPQYPTLPAEPAPIPEGFDWNLWLGPEAERPYHPHYTHMVFRGWYDFGGGSLADMGHYSLWTVFNALELSAPTLVDPMYSHNCVLRDGVSTTIRNDFSFPTAGAVRFRYPAKGWRPEIELIWHEGGMRPPVPDELDELPLEGMMFVGDKGKIVGGFRVESPRLIRNGVKAPPPEPAERRRPQREPGELSEGLKQWIAACRGDKQHSKGSFLNAWPISEAANLYAVSYRAGRRLQYDAATMTIANAPDANRYLAREYRKGFEPPTA